MDKCVLVVDDNDFNRELVRDILEDEDITVYEAEDGSSAIELLESEQADDIDAVLMDVRMPGMDGLETTKIIRTKNGKCTDVPIIAMTADGLIWLDQDFCSMVMAILHRNLDLSQLCLLRQQ